MSYQQITLWEHILDTNHDDFEKYRKLSIFNYELDNNKIIEFTTFGRYVENCKGFILDENDERYIVQLCIPKQLNWGRGCMKPSRYYMLVKSRDSFDNSGFLKYYPYNVQTLQECVFKADVFETFCKVNWRLK